MSAALEKCIVRQGARIASGRSAQLFRGFHHSRHLAQKEAAQIAESFLSKFANGQRFVRKQLLDANQLRLLSLTLDRPHIWKEPATKSLEESEPKEGTPLPAGYHLAYFTPAQLPGALGVDGTDTSYNPEAPFTRRMWAGGSLQWPGADPTKFERHSLKVGDVAMEVTRVISCEPKTIKKTGEAMLVVGVVKEFFDSHDNLCVIDNRNWVFREALDPTKPAKSAVKPTTLGEAELQQANQGKHVRSFNRDTTQLFRFSALTLNPHRIHYDRPWAIDVEGHRDTVVHGPLNMISILDFWRDTKGNGDVLYPKFLEYRATSPIYVREPYRITLPQASSVDGEAEIPVEVVSDDGTMCMKGKIGQW